MRVNVDECEMRSGCAWKVSTRVWSCSSFHLCLYIVGAGTDSGNSSWHYFILFFYCCIFLLHDIQYWKTKECQNVSIARLILLTLSLISLFLSFFPFRIFIQKVVVYIFSGIYFDDENFLLYLFQ